LLQIKLTTTTTKNNILHLALILLTRTILLLETYGNFDPDLKGAKKNRNMANPPLDDRYYIVKES